MHREALATIIYGVETRKGFLVCTGEVGTGKSTIVRAFFDQTHEDAVKLIYIFTPQVTPLEMAQYICRELGMSDPASVFAAVPQLQLKLLEIFESDRTVVLMIDEAQLLPPETLEFLRLLSNFETDTEKLIQIVLVGQPEVDSTLARPDMRQVNQRVALRARLAALSVEESFDYIEHRLRVCGAGDLRQVMSPSAAWLIAEAAGGIPRRINILADNALIAGFGAGQRPLGSQLAGNAVNEFLAKSGAAGPVNTQRFAAGWRAARRLRGALAREKDEPAEWISRRRPASPHAAGASGTCRRVAIPVSPPITFVGPPQVPPSGAAMPGFVRSASPTLAPGQARVDAEIIPAAPPKGEDVRPVLSEPPAAIVEPVAHWAAAPGTAVSGTAVTMVEPVSPPADRIGSPVSSSGIGIVEPVAQGPVTRPATARPPIPEDPRTEIPLPRRFSLLRGKRMAARLPTRPIRGASPPGRRYGRRCRGFVPACKRPPRAAPPAFDAVVNRL